MEVYEYMNYVHRGTCISKCMSGKESQREKNYFFGLKSDKLERFVFRTLKGI